MRLSAALPIFCLLALAMFHRTANGQSCNGVFDLYFVLDSSASISPRNFRQHVIPFVEGVINHYDQSGFRVAIVTFDDKSIIQLNLTQVANRSSIDTSLNKLRSIDLGPATKLTPALQIVSHMITSGPGDDITSIVLILTDGGVSNPTSARQEADKLRNRNITIIAVGVAGFIRQQLLDLTGQVSELVITETNFDRLNQLLDDVIELICVYITMPNTTIHETLPLKYCRGQFPSINMTGTGFNTLNTPNCHFWTTKAMNTSYRYDAWHTQPIVEDTLLSCPTPDTGGHIGNLSMQVTTRNRYKESETTLYIEDCRRLIEAIPNKWCISELVNTINVTGVALTDGLNSSNVHCKYVFENGEEHLTYPVGEITYEKIVCPTYSPNDNFTLKGSITVKLSLDGVTYVPNSLIVRVNDCTPFNYALVAGVVGGLLGLLALLSLCCLLWCFFPLITGVIVGGAAAKEEEEPLPVATPPIAPPPPPPAAPKRPGRKWSIVDTSYYGIRGAGGIRPVKVRWGNKGTTEEGAKLKRAEDAIKLGEVEVQGPPITVTSSGSGLGTIDEDDETSLMSTRKPGCCKLCCRFCYQHCCGLLISKIKRCYTVISSYRPVFTYHGTLGKQILCCPGPNIEEKLSGNETTPASNGRLGKASRMPHSLRPVIRSNGSGNEIQQPLLENLTN